MNQRQRRPDRAAAPVPVQPRLQRTARALRRRPILARPGKLTSAAGASRRGAHAYAVVQAAHRYEMSTLRRGGRVAEGGGLLNRYRVVKPYRGFESPSLRHFPSRQPHFRMLTDRKFSWWEQSRLGARNGDNGNAVARFDEAGEVAPDQHAIDGCPIIRRGNTGMVGGPYPCNQIALAHGLTEIDARFEQSV